LYVRPAAPSVFLGLGQSMRALASIQPEAAARSLGGIGALRAEVGWLALTFAALGGLVSVVRPRLRGLAVPLVTAAVLDALLSFREGRLFSAEDLAPLHLICFGALAVGVAVAVQTVATSLLSLDLPMARGATVFLVMTDVTVVAASAEEASFAADRSGEH